MSWHARLRSTQYDRYLCGLLLPAPLREQYAVLVQWNQELARIRYTVSDPMIGYIRLQWWQDALADMQQQKAPKGHELLDALVAHHAEKPFNLALLQGIVTGYEQEMEAPQPVSWMDARHQARQTSGLFYLLLREYLGAGDAAQDKDVALTVGEINGLWNVLKTLPEDRVRGQCFLPSEIVDSDMINNQNIDVLALEEAVQSYSDRLLADIRHCEAQLRVLPPLARRLLYPSLVLVASYVQRIRRRGYARAHATLQHPSVGTMLRLLCV